jgi:hypothetical protein
MHARLAIVAVLLTLGGALSAQAAKEKFEPMTANLF